MQYNEAIKSWNLVGMVHEKDHGLSRKGYQQCLNLRTAIAVAAAAGNIDAIALSSSDRVTCASPLSRAMVTAMMALPAVGTPSPIVALPNAREHCMLPIFSRDSEGTLAEYLEARVSSETLRCSAQGPLQPRPRIDVSRCGSGQWWTVAESGAAVDRRLGEMLIELARVADSALETKGAGAEAAPAVVCVGHSHALRRMLRTYATPAFAASPLGMRFCSEMLANCAIIKVRLQDAEAAEEPPRVAGAEMLFDSTFK